ncbi:MAG: hypothetical protein KBT32_09900, partial [Bacteroidales bacterium]|nr:hypothetical protein [Candidatus Physcocola equi]
LQSQWASIAPFRFSSKHPEKSTYKNLQQKFKQLLKDFKFEIVTKKAAKEYTITKKKLSLKKVTI